MSVKNLLAVQRNSNPPGVQRLEGRQERLGGGAGGILETQSHIRLIFIIHLTYSKAHIGVMWIFITN
jgi:hypothetical protein